MMNALWQDCKYSLGILRRNPGYAATAILSLLTGIGLGLGLGATLALSRYLKSELYEVQPIDPPSLITTALLIVAVALIASLIPAHRAAMIDPMTALRHE